MFWRVRTSIYLPAGEPGVWSVTPASSWIMSGLNPTLFGWSDPPGSKWVTSHIIIDIARINAQGEEHFDVEKAFNGGLADIDVCWNSRGDPCSEKTKSLKLQYLCFYWVNFCQGELPRRGGGAGAGGGGVRWRGSSPGPGPVWWPGLDSVLSWYRASWQINYKPHCAITRSFSLLSKCWKT